MWAQDQRRQYVEKCDTINDMPPRHANKTKCVGWAIEMWRGKNENVLWVFNMDYWTHGLFIELVL